MEKAEGEVNVITMLLMDKDRSSSRGSILEETESAEEME